MKKLWLGGAVVVLLGYGSAVVYNNSKQDRIYNGILKGMDSLVEKTMEELPVNYKATNVIVSEKESYSFNPWKKSDDIVGMFTIDSILPNDDLKLVLTYSLGYHTSYTSTFDVKGSVVLYGELAKEYGVAQELANFEGKIDGTSVNLKIKENKIKAFDDGLNIILTPKEEPSTLKIDYLKETKDYKYDYKGGFARLEIIDDTLGSKNSFKFKDIVIEESGTVYDNTFGKSKISVDSLNSEYLELSKLLVTSETKENYIDFKVSLDELDVPLIDMLATNVAFEAEIKDAELKGLKDLSKNAHSSDEDYAKELLRLLKGGFEFNINKLEAKSNVGDFSITSKYKVSKSDSYKDISLKDKMSIDTSIKLSKNLMGLLNLSTGMMLDGINEANPDANKDEVVFNYNDSQIMINGVVVDNYYTDDFIDSLEDMDENIQQDVVKYDLK